MTYNTVQVILLHINGEILIDCKNEKNNYF